MGRPSPLAPAVSPANHRLTIEQAAEFFQCSTKSLYEFIAKREWFPGVIRIGRLIRIDVPRFEAGLRQQQLRKGSRLRRAG